jgi:hypothetical protein
MNVSRTTLTLLVALSVADLAEIHAADRFNYVATNEDNYGPEDWNMVGCDELETCVSKERICMKRWLSLFLDEVEVRADDDAKSLLGQKSPSLIP